LLQARKAYRAVLGLTVSPITVSVDPAGGELVGAPGEPRSQRRFNDFWR